MIKLEVGKTYVDQRGNKWKCIYETDDKYVVLADYITRKQSAIVWNESLKVTEDHYLIAEHKEPVVHELGWLVKYAVEGGGYTAIVFKGESEIKKQFGDSIHTNIHVEISREKITYTEE